MSPSNKRSSYVVENPNTQERPSRKKCVERETSKITESSNDKLWIGLENFVFDWLINADRIVSQVEYSSLVDLRGLFLDLVAQLLGALSFSSVTEHFFMELDTRRIDTSRARSETLSVINGMRYLKLGVKTEGGLNASVSFMAKANPLNRAPHKRKSELRHALCNMLSKILAPLADGGKGDWPPPGVHPTLNMWYEAVARIRVQFMHWIDKQSKYIAVAYPLVTLLLCLRDPIVLFNNFGPHMEQMYKHLWEEGLRPLLQLKCKVMNDQPQEEGPRPLLQLRRKVINYQPQVRTSDLKKCHWPFPSNHDMQVQDYRTLFIWLGT
nr:protein furry homolog-like [Tanacetum cinerariifolium]